MCMDNFYYFFIPNLFNIMLLKRPFNCLQIVENHYDTTLVLEDDVHFVPYFKKKILQVLEEIKEIDWDLL